MYGFFRFLFFPMVVGILPFFANASALTVDEIRCEYAVDPIGLEQEHPRFSWILRSDSLHQKQRAYQIIVARDMDKLNGEMGDVWDSGRVESGRSIQIPYAGAALRSFQDYVWKVRVWDEKDVPSDWSRTGRWTMGVLHEEEWKARWITFPEDENQAEQNTLSPLPLIRKEFQLAKKVRSANLFICGLGFYELFLNGEKVGDRLLEPGWTDYRDTCLYSTYDVSELLPPGNHAVGVMLGNGMYNVEGGRYVKFTGSFGPPKCIAQLQLEFEDGTTDAIVTDESWRAAPSPIVFTCIFGGEDYDARLEIPDWNRAGFDDSSWRQAQVCDGPGGRLVSQQLPPIRVMREFTPVRVTQPRPDIFVYDLGQNFSGIPKIKARGARGNTVKITPAELLTEEGLANQSASGGPHHYSYTLKGGVIEEWQPRFTYYGFRYLQVEGAVPADAAGENDVALLDIRGLFTRQSAERIGAFCCSSELYNQIFQLLDWSVGSNLQSVLTDCPHREKLGWLEVAHLMAPSIMYTYDVPLFYNKVARDMRDSQLPNGLVPDIAPEFTVFSGGFRDSPEWGSACVILPWLTYQWYGDRRILTDNYERMKRYVDYLVDCSENHLISHGLGDWFDYVRGGSVGESRLTPKRLTASAIFYHDIDILVRTADLLGKDEDAAHYMELRKQVREAFHRALFDPNTNQYATGSQTANAMPLALDLVDRERIEAVFTNLVNEVKDRGYLTAGDVGFRFLLRALAEQGRSDLIYSLTHRTDEPGYGYQIQQGATSLTEAWDGRKVVSHNHCMLGHLQEWFFQELAGIKRDPQAPAFEKIIIDPQLVGDIEWARASYRSMYGTIASHWQRKEREFLLQIEIPVNTEATVILPAADSEKITINEQPINEMEGMQLLRYEQGKAVVRIGSGRYAFRSWIP
ncbi:MAG: alpha-L-rhamnosidase [Candidatus Omnitrophota bacterium]|jgi:hypothetical protein|nr:MAG: alpha-L-rhamnosidase [Candidatus Omnitrophota bacterium]